MWDSILFVDNFRNKQVLPARSSVIFVICEFFFIMNYLQCVRGAWYLAADMQLYLLTPFLVLLLQRYPKRFMGFSFAIISLDFILSWNRALFGLNGLVINKLI